MKQLQADLAEQLMDRIQGIDFESEEERLNFQAKIEKKIRSGAKLSRKEMNYLRKYNPYMYLQMVRVQRKREALKEQLKHCRTKEEAQQIIGAAFSSISEKDPVREAMVAAVCNVSKQFCASEYYKKLPDTKEDLKKEKDTERCQADPFQEDAEGIGAEGVVYETVRYSFGKGGYQEATSEGGAEINVFSANA